MPEIANASAPYLALGLRVTKYRNRRGLLQRELAAEMRIDPAVLSKIENGTRRATRDQAQWLSEHARIAMRWWGYSHTNLDEQGTVDG